MTETQKIIDTLWQEGRAKLPDPMNPETTAYLDRTRERVLDILIVMDPPYKAEQVGFITLSKKFPGLYQMWASKDMHPLIPAYDNVGLAVRPEYQFRKFGTTLISLGLGIAQKETQEEGSNQFLVFGKDPTPDAIKLYSKAGFKITHYPEGRVDYDSLDIVPKIQISREPSRRERRAIRKRIRGLWPIE
jgi:ribosomal protein S18 acetylase RimI-like enzyme